MENSSDTPTPTQNALMASNSQSHTRVKKDIGWEYCTEAVGIDGKKLLICSICRKNIKGGGITRMKKHLAGVKGDVEPCLKVSANVRFRIQESLNEIKERRENQGCFASNNPIELDNEFDDRSHRTSNASNRNKRTRSEIGMKQYFPSGNTAGFQPSIKASMQSNERLYEVDMAMARFFYDACIPMNAINSYYLQPWVDAIASVGLGYKVPTYHKLGVNLLADAKKEVQLWIDSLRSCWEESGCTIMGDGWKDSRQRPLINFLVYCPRGISFIKSVDASNIVCDAAALSRLFCEIVEIVGPKNVVHMVTDNASNYKAAGDLLCEKYPTISWSPCAAHCLHLILEDIAKFPNVATLAQRASCVTVFVYNHEWTLGWLRRRDGWKEILRPGETHFATTFIALKSISEHKLDLQNMVVSKEYSDWSESRTVRAKQMQDVVLDSKFWNDCLVVCKVVEPLLRLLRIVNSDDRPALGYVYEGMYRARKGIKNTFENNKSLYKSYTSVIKKRWDKQLCKDIHVAAYWLNPAFQYDQKKLCTKPEVMRGLMKVIERKCVDSQNEMVSENSIFRNREMGFSSKVAFETSKTTRPDEWWKTFGFDVPNLQKLAVRLLSQTASSSGCERNWGVFERVHTKKRNRLAHERLSDIVFVHYNLRLQKRVYNKNRLFDPLDYENIDKIDCWVIPEEDLPELNMEDLEEMAARPEPTLSQAHGNEGAIVVVGDSGGSGSCSGSGVGGGGGGGGDDIQIENLRIREGRSKPFIVEDHCSELYKKHHPPSLHDDIWHLEKIAKDGAFHKRLARHGVLTVNDFLLLYESDPSSLRNMIGNQIPSKEWETIVEHANECVPDEEKFYTYTGAAQSVRLLFNSIYKVVAATFDGQTYIPIETLDLPQKLLVEDVKSEAYKNMKGLVSVVAGSTISPSMALVNLQPEISQTSSLQIVEFSTAHQDEPGTHLAFCQQLSFAPSLYEAMDMLPNELYLPQNSHPMQMFNPLLSNSSTNGDLFPIPDNGENHWPPSASQGELALQSSQVPTEDIIASFCMPRSSIFFTTENHWPPSASQGELALQSSQVLAEDIPSPLWNQGNSISSRRKMTENQIFFPFPAGSFGVHMRRFRTYQAQWCKIRSALIFYAVGRDVAAKRLGARRDIAAKRVGASHFFGLLEI